MKERVDERMDEKMNDCMDECLDECMDETVVESCQIFKLNTGADMENPVLPIHIDHYLWMDNDYKPQVEVRLGYDREKIAVNFKVFEENPLIRYLNPDDPVYKDSCVEFFFQPSPETDPRYLNFEMNGAGTLLAGLGTGRGDRIRPEFRPGEEVKVHSGRGTHGENGPFWEITLTLSTGWIRCIFPDFSPGAGAVCRGNFYKCGDETARVHYGCWNPVKASAPDFHRSCDFGRLVFQ